MQQVGIIPLCTRLGVVPMLVGLPGRYVARIAPGGPIA